MIKYKHFLFALTLIPVIVSSCRKKDNPEEAIVSPNVKITFRNYVDDQPLVLEKGNYINAAGDSFTIKTYKYYISNIRLVNTDGTEYVEKESYHLIDESKTPSKSFILNNVPAGNYTSIKFMIGVDSLRNVSGAQTGALDPLNDMFWDWESGYIMAKLEGKSPSSPFDQNIAYHITGYGGPNKVIKTVSLNLSKTINVSIADTKTITLRSNVNEWFKTPTLIEFKTLPINSVPGEEAAIIGNNYADMFSIESVE